MFFDNIDFSTLELPPAALKLRDEVRTFLRAELAAGSYTPHLGHAEYDEAFTKKVAARGWIGMTWPTEYGGPGWTPVQRYIFEKECALADAPGLPVLGLKLLAPVVWTFGKAAQKAHYLPRVASGQAIAAFALSEPEAGSDVAAMACEAQWDGDHYVITGEKTWISNGGIADIYVLFARTGEAPVRKVCLHFYCLPAVKG